MRTVLATALASSLAATSGGLPTTAWADATFAVAPKPEELFDQGKKAFRLGRYEEAVTKFEAAYDATGEPLLLYNIGLAYKEWYGVSKEIDHLRKAKAVFQNFVREAHRDPERLDPADAEARLKEAEDMLKKAEEEEAERKRREAEAEAAAAAAAGKEGKGSGPKRVGPDPGKNLRLGGTIAMGVGGALLLGGVVSGVIFSLKGKEFSENLDNIRRDLNTFPGLDEGVACEKDPSSRTEDEADFCRLKAEERTTIDNGRKANTLTVVSFAAIAGLGLVGLATGGGLFGYGIKKTRAWEEGRTVKLRLSPVASPTFAGISLSGRF